MKIKDVVVRLFERPVDSRLWNPAHRWSTKPVVLVIVLTEDGMVGIGEASTSISPAGAVVAALRDELAPMLRGRSVYEVRAIAAEVLLKLSINQSFGAFGHGWSGIDIALWDLIGQRAGMPVHKLLGQFRGQVYGYASAGLYRDGGTLDDLAEEAAGYVAEGFQAVKIKVGGLALEDDVARVATVRRAIGPERRLMVDAAGALRFDQAARFERAIRDLDIYWFEAPIGILDWHGLARFRARTKTPIAAHEGLFGLHAFDGLIRLEAVDFVQFNVTCCGGITEGMRIAARAAAANLLTTLQFAGSFVGLAASFQLAAAIEHCDSVEIHMIHRWLEEHRDGGEWSRDGSVYSLGDRPGIGLADETRRRLMEAD